MQHVSNYILDPENGAILCANCPEPLEMAICTTRLAYACDETERGHFSIR